MPTVSVIIPNYNHARYLRRRIDSVLQQTYQDLEVILLDDGSTDNSREIIASYAGDPRARIELNETNSGTVFKQWNKGVSMAQGRYIWIAESDDYADPAFLAKTVTILEEQPEVTVAYCRSWCVGENDERLGYADSYLDRLDANHWASDFVVDGMEECRRFFALCDPIPNTSAVVFRKNIYEKTGRADERFRMCSDYKMWAAMAFEGKIAYVAEPLNYYRSHGENVRTSTQANALGAAELFYMILWVLNRVAPSGTLPEKDSIEQLLSVLPVHRNPSERIECARQSLAYIADWNLRNNSHLDHHEMYAYFMDWDFALVGKGFDISQPSRWQFFLHRCRFFAHYFRRSGWKPRMINLLRVLGAPVVGYRHRHFPEQVYARVLRMMGAANG
jgi:glycosyltransferase involved in cell wall biosynthesis